MNSVSLTGRAGRDPEARYLENGSCVANFSLPIDRYPKGEGADWITLELWGKLAEVAVNYVRKGSLVGIVGSLKFDRWTDRASGDERSKPVIRVDRLELLQSRRDSLDEGASGGSAPTEPAGRRSPGASRSRPAAAARPAPLPGLSREPSEDDIPF